MAETVLVRCESGCVIPHDLPLPEGLRKRVEKGEAQVLGPAPVDGEAVPAPVAVPDPERGLPSTRVRRAGARVAGM